MRLALGLALVGTATAAAAEPVRKIVAAVPEGSPWADALLAMPRQVSERTGGRIKLRAVAGGLAGDELATAQMCTEGKVFAWGGSMGAFGRIIPELDAFELPFLFDSPAEVEAALAGRPLAPLARVFERAGYVLVPGLGEVGWRSFAGRRPLRTLEDLRGLRVRSQESPVHLAMWRALGARPQAISVLETLSALQTGLVEAVDQSPVFLFATSWYQHARVYSLSRHMYQPGILLLCKGALSGIAPKDQKVIVEVLGRGLRESVARVRALEAQVLAQLATEGVQLVELTPAERAALRQRTRSVTDAFRQAASPLGRELLETLVRASAGHRR